MSFSKAPVKRFNDIDTADVLSSPSPAATESKKEAIQKFWRENVTVQPATSTKEPKDKSKESKSKSSSLKGLRLFRTPSLPHRLRFHRQNSDITSAATQAKLEANLQPKISSTPLKGKEALHNHIRIKNQEVEELTLQVEKFKLVEIQLKDENTQLASKLLDVEEELATFKNNEIKLQEKIEILDNEMKILISTNNREASKLQITKTDLDNRNTILQKQIEVLMTENSNFRTQIESLTVSLEVEKEKLNKLNSANHESLLNLESLRLKNSGLLDELDTIKRRIEEDAFAYAQETTGAQHLMEKQKSEIAALADALVEKEEMIEGLKEELIDKNIEVDSLEEQISKFAMDEECNEEKIRIAEIQVEQKFKKLESDIEKEQKYWHNEIVKYRNEMLQCELEKKDIQVLLETANEMVQERDTKISEYEKHLSNLSTPVDYYVQHCAGLEKQVNELEQKCSKTYSEKEAYHLALTNTRLTLRTCMERLTKSDSDVDSLKVELEAMNSSKNDIERKYSEAEGEIIQLRAKILENEAALTALVASSSQLQNEMNERANIIPTLFASEEEIIQKIQILQSLVEKYGEAYTDLKKKYDDREAVINNNEQLFEEYSRVFQVTQIELDNKDKELVTLRQDNDNLKLENISLKSQSYDKKKLNNEDDLDKLKDKIEDCDNLQFKKHKLIEENVNEYNNKITEKILTPKKINLTPSKRNTPHNTPKSLKKINFPAAIDNKTAQEVGGGGGSGRNSFVTRNF